MIDRYCILVQIGLNLLVVSVWFELFDLYR